MRCDTATLTQNALMRTIMGQSNGTVVYRAIVCTTMNSCGMRQSSRLEMAAALYKVHHRLYATSMNYR
jgi:hypothetical protein